MYGNYFGFQSTLYYIQGLTNIILMIIILFTVLSIQYNSDLTYVIPYEISYYDVLVLIRCCTYVEFVLQLPCFVPYLLMYVILRLIHVKIFV